LPFTILENTLIGQPIAESSPIARHILGTIIRAKDPTYGAGEFIYLKGVVSTIVGSFALYNPDDFSTSLLVANDIGPVAASMSANVANQFGLVPDRRQGRSQSWHGRRQRQRLRYRDPRPG
jgi:hypothetical protein